MLNIIIHHTEECYGDMKWIKLDQDTLAVFSNGVYELPGSLTRD
jgi:hypothetical protein